MIKFLLGLSLLACVVLAGCSGQHCIKIGGGYTYDDGQKIDGNLEYCYDQRESEKNKTPVVKDANGKKYMLLSEDDARKILETKAAASASQPASESPFGDLKKSLK